MNRIDAVAENLHFDMASVANELFKVEPAISEGCLGLGGGLIERCAKRFDGFRDADATSAAARRSLDHDGKADFLRELPRFIKICNAAFGTGHDRHARALRRTARRGLVAHGSDRLAFRTDEDQPGRLYRFREDGILGEKAVTRMNGVRAGRLGRGKNRFDVEIGFRRLERTDIDRFVRHANRQRVGVGCAVNLNGFDAKLPRRALNAHGYLAAIGDQQS